MAYIAMADIVMAWDGSPEALLVCAERAEVLGSPGYLCIRHARMDIRVDMCMGM